MKDFIHADFLLKTATARRLYHEHAVALPIIDYHSHLNPAELAADRKFADVTELWIEPDQYKHRVMRSLGVAERFILGDASPREKFDHWAAAAPLTMGNPLFHWAALELKHYFGITEPLDATSAARIWEACNAQLRQPTHSSRQLLTRSNVEYVCSSDLLLDDVSHHKTLAASGFATRIAPSLRADNAFLVEAPGFVEWVKKLGAVTGIVIDGLEAFKQALRLRLDVFAASGCTVSDHGIDVFNYCSMSEGEADALFKTRYSGMEFTAEDALRLRSHILVFLGREYARRNWVMLLHIGAQRQTSTRLHTVAGAKGGYAALGNPTDIPSLCRFLDDLDRAEQLPRTILFNLNPADNQAFATLTGSYAQEGVAGKIQFGPAWWFNDHDAGIRAHLDALSRHGLLINFIGMTTDSRSLLSMSRHEYFRRVFCDWLGQQVEQGMLPADDALLADLVRRVCYENARNWFSPATK
jgi:glucuronate isomerase